MLPTAIETRQKSYRLQQKHITKRRRTYNEPWEAGSVVMMVGWAADVTMWFFQLKMLVDRRQKKERNW